MRIEVLVGVVGIVVFAIVFAGGLILVTNKDVREEG